MHERYTYTGSCSIETLDGSLVVDGLVSNIGAFGACVQVGPWLTNEGIEWLDTGLRVFFETLIQPLNSKDTLATQLSILGKVAWADRSEKNLLGVYFLAMMPYQRRLLLALIDECKAGVR